MDIGMYLSIKSGFSKHPEEIRNYFIVLVIMIFLAIWAYKKLYKDIADVL